jgi:hypothetical protein
MASTTLSRRGHLLLAALLWSLVGTFLLINGSRLWFGAPAFDAGSWQDWGLALTAVGVGLLKGGLVLDRSAARLIARAPENPQQRPLDSLYRMFGPRMLLLIASMCALGILLRLAPVSGALRGWILMAIGAALVWSSRRYWSAMRVAAAGRAIPAANREEETA